MRRDNQGRSLFTHLTSTPLLDQKTRGVVHSL